MGFSATLTSRVLIALNGVDGPDYYQAGDANLYPGMIVMEDDADEVKICTSTGKPIGVVGCDADHDLNTAYSAGERVPIWKLGSGVDIYVRCKDAGAMSITKGAIMDSSDLTTFNGYGHLKDTYIVLTTANADTAGTARNMTNYFWIGTALETGSITTNTARFVPVKLSI